MLKVDILFQGQGVMFPDERKLYSSSVAVQLLKQRQDRTEQPVCCSHSCKLNVIGSDTVQHNLASLL